MRGIPFGVAVVTAGLYFLGLGQAPFLDPPEGFHAEIGRSRAQCGARASGGSVHLVARGGGRSLYANLAQ